jgi:hypothetical protein
MSRDWPTAAVHPTSKHHSVQSAVSFCCRQSASTSPASSSRPPAQLPRQCEPHYCVPLSNPQLATRSTPGPLCTMHTKLLLDISLLRPPSDAISSSSNSIATPWCPPTTSPTSPTSPPVCHHELSFAKSPRCGALFSVSLLGIRLPTRFQIEQHQIGIFHLLFPSEAKLLELNLVKAYVQISLVFLHLCIDMYHSSVLHYSDGTNYLGVDGVNLLRKGRV